MPVGRTAGDRAPEKTGRGWGEGPLAGRNPRPWAEGPSWGEGRGATATCPTLGAAPATPPGGTAAGGATAAARALTATAVPR